VTINVAPAPVAPRSCTAWGQTIPDGGTVRWYNQATVISPATCTGGTYTCSDGQLIGYIPGVGVQNCTVINSPPPPTCPAGQIGTPPNCVNVCVPNSGAACTSAANSCGSTNPGTIQCDGSCSASAPANPASYGQACVLPTIPAGTPTREHTTAREFVARAPLRRGFSTVFSEFVSYRPYAPLDSPAPRPIVLAMAAVVALARTERLIIPPAPPARTAEPILHHALPKPVPTVPW
jgi:hypothetical protein